MCGICGSTSDPRRLAVAAMCAALRHRGPDEEGSYASPSAPVALGARRLSVIDVEGGRQPRSDEDERVWAVLNGEIYNHPVIRDRLAARGHVLRGRSDTEVLVHLYEDHGDDLVHALEGMFALAIWDERRRRLLLARDRFGEKPLFYARRGADLLFASELTALVAGLERTPDLDPAAFDAFFTLGYVPGTSGSILRGVRQLPPGHLLSWDGDTGRVHERRYWAAPQPVAEIRESPRELAAESLRLLRRSIDGRLLADVPLGVFLSGGVDSTVLAAIAAERSSRPLKTFTIGFGEAEGAEDERAASRRTAALVGSEHRDVALDGRTAAERSPGLLASLDQPLADPAFVPLHLVAEFAREEVVVAIGGEGADELFGGYPRYAWLGRASRGWRWNGRLSGALGGRVPPASSSSHRARRAVDLAVPRPLAERHLDWVTAGRRHLRPRLYGPALRAMAADDRVLAELRAGLERSRSHAVAGSLMHLDQLGWLPDDVLAKADRAGMLASLEVRTPYLHRELAEFAAGVTPAVHVARGGKRLLKAVLADVLPRAPRRRKVAFMPPLASWLRGPMAPLAERQIATGSLYEEGWIQPAAAARLLAEHRTGHADRSQVLWPLLAAGWWLDRFRGAEVA